MHQTSNVGHSFQQLPCEVPSESSDSLEDFGSIHIQNRSLYNTLHHLPGTATAADFPKMEHLERKRVGTMEQDGTAFDHGLPWLPPIYC